MIRDPYAFITARFWIKFDRGINTKEGKSRRLKWNIRSENRTTRDVDLESFCCRLIWKVCFLAKIHRIQISNYLCAKSVYKHLLREKQYSSATHDGRNAILIRIRNHEKRDHEIFELVFCKRVDGREAKTRKFNSQRKSHFPFPRRTGKLARVVRVAARKFSCKSK